MWELFNPIDFEARALVQNVSGNITSLLEYLVLKMLTGNGIVVEALKMYIVDEMSPSTVASKLGLSKHQIRGYAQRVVEKIGDFRKAFLVISEVYDLLMRIKPIVSNYGHRKICMVCGRELSTSGEDHVKRYHREVVEDYVYSILTILKIRVSKRMASRIHQMANTPSTSSL